MIRRLVPGALTFLLLGLVIGGAFAGLLRAAGTADYGAFLDSSYTRRVVTFTVWQALLSTLLSVGPAILVARAMARRPSFPGRALLLRLFGLPLVLPTLVGILGVVAVYGQSGLVNRFIAALGVQPRQFLYGLPGILIAHAFFNLPLAVRLLLPVWGAIPGETWRLATQLGMNSRQVFRLIEWPLLRQALPGAAGLVFMLCFTSFAIVLTLGGGPANSTIEVAIFQAVRFEFDLGRAIQLALLQVGICGFLVVAGQRFIRDVPLTPTVQRPQDRPDAAAWGGRILDAVVLLAAAAFVLLPLAAVLENGLAGPVAKVLADSHLWLAVGRSLGVAVSAGLLATAAGWGLLLTSRELRLRRYRPRAATAMETIASLVLVVPPLVIGTGLFALLSPVADVFAIGIVLVVIVNAIMGLPYVIRTLGPPLMRAGEQHDRLCASLGIAGWNRLRLVEWPLLRRPVGTALALTAALAIGDLGVIALFGTQDTATLPLLLYQRMAAYQLDAAAVTAVVLAALCFGLFAVIERGVGGHGRR
ncbi:MAG TPA: thiamine/thiamine pyrophosphate ABC transporter permease [Candidatus Angelobacter sp.]|nr:thiamine/thiamine pyrophosphate ABC transporter permease [Candidatus Angelobacter sp.]